jgi:hypothetical protein
MKTLKQVFAGWMRKSPTFTFFGEMCDDIPALAALVLLLSLLAIVVAGGLVVQLLAKAPTTLLVMTAVLLSAYLAARFLGSVYRSK